MIWLWTSWNSQRAPHAHPVTYWPSCSFRSSPFLALSPFPANPIPAHLPMCSRFPLISPSVNMWAHFHSGFLPDCLDYNYLKNKDLYKRGMIFFNDSCCSQLFWCNQPTPSVIQNYVLLQVTTTHCKQPDLHNSILWVRILHTFTVEDDVLVVGADVSIEVQAVSFI